MTESRTCLEKIRKFILAHRMMKKGDTVIVCVSGGIDSVCLLDVLLKLRKQLGISIHVAHVDHSLRGDESDADERFVRALARKNELKYHFRKLDKHIYIKREFGLTTKQEIARKARHDAYWDFADSIKGNVKIATGHNLSDNAETVIMRISRGTSLHGLCGIRPKRDILIRPLLCLSRAEIEEYANENAVPFREDSSNRSMDYTRNLVRSRIMPLLNDVHNNSEVNISNTVALIRDDLQLINDRILSLHTLEKTPFGYHSRTEQESMKKVGIARRLVYNAIIDLSSTPKEISKKHVDRILGAIKTRGSFRMSIPGGVVYWQSCSQFVISRTEMIEKMTRDWKIDIPGKLEATAGNWEITCCSAEESEKARSAGQISLEAEISTGFPIVARSWQDGDRIAGKSLKRYFNKSRIPAFYRKLIPVIENSQGDIVAVPSVKIITDQPANSNDQKVYLGFIPL